MPERILIVEDSHALRESLVRLLESESYEVMEAEDGAEGLAQVSRFHPDVVIMDVNMPRMNGLEAIARLREFSDVPVLVLSVRSAMTEKVTGLDAGADDYLGKPFGVEELLARVRALLRRRRTAHNSSAAPMALRLGGGDLTIDLAEQRVLRHGQVVHLTPLEARLLFALAQQPGNTVSHEQLLETVWHGEPSVTLRNLKLYVLYLRRKIEPDPTHPRYLLTSRGTGYRLAVL